MTSLFVSHGAPTLVIDPVPARDYLSAQSGRFDEAKAIIVVSAHWETPGETRVASRSDPETIHDFWGFPKPLYEMDYAAPGAPETAGKVVEVLRAAGISAHADPERGFDHGVWVPLMLMRPAADLPVIPVSLDPNAGPEGAYRLGEALKPLRDDGFAVLATGALTHNLRAMNRGGMTAPPRPEVTAFQEWIADRVEADDREGLLSYRGSAPGAVSNHPTDEHLLPLFTALGAGGAGTRVHDSVTYAALAMDCYSFA